jgi:hypothetical protein
MARAMAVGGFKSISNTGPLRPLTVDIYDAICVVPGTDIDEHYYHGTYQFNNFGETLTQYDVVNALNADQEFLDWRQYSSAFIVRGATISFNYCRMPRDGEVFPQMILSPETDVVDFVPDPLQEKNTMKWDMTQPGTKNYNVKFVRRNMFTQDLGWQQSSNGWTGTYKLKIGSVNNELIKIKFEGNEESGQPLVIGTLHITFRVLFRTLDQAHDWSKEVGGVKHPVPTKIKRKLLEKMFLQQYMKETGSLVHVPRVQFLDQQVKNGGGVLLQQDQSLPVELPEMSVQLTNYDLTY